MRSLVVLALALVACSDPADWRPAKGAADHPSAKDAYRVQEAPIDCPTIGYVQAHGGRDPIADIAETAAKHGGTHYVVYREKDHAEQVSETSGAVYGGAFAASTRTHTEHHRSIWAEVYRCTD